MILFFGDVGGGMIPWLELSVLLLVCFFFNDFVNKSYREVVLGYDGCMYVCMYVCISVYMMKKAFCLYLYLCDVCFIMMTICSSSKTYY